MRKIYLHKRFDSFDYVFNSNSIIYIFRKLQ